MTAPDTTPATQNAASQTAQVAAEFVGTAFLLMTVVGSGIMAVRLTADPGLQLLQTAIATGLILLALIGTFGSVSGAHFNPCVTLGFRWQGDIDARTAGLFIAAQVGGGLFGTILANLMFEVDAVAVSTTDRTGGGLLLAEVIATLGLLLVIFGPVRNREPGVVPFIPDLQGPQQFQKLADLLHRRPHRPLSKVLLALQGGGLRDGLPDRGLLQA